MKEFFTLKVYGRGVRLLINVTSFLAIFYAGACVKFIIGLMGASVLWIFIKPFILGGNGFRFIRFHFMSIWMIVEHVLIVFLMSFWYLFV